MVNIGEISKPSGGVSPLKSARKSGATNKIDEIERNAPVEELEQSDQQKQKKNRANKKLSKRADNSKVKEEEVPIDLTYDESGRKTKGGKIDFSV